MAKWQKKCGISSQTLRYYESIDLIKPQFIDKNTGYRYYSDVQFNELLIIRFFKSYGFTLIEIRDFIRAKGSNDVSKLYLRKIETIEAEIETLQAARRKLKHCHFELIRGLKNNSNPKIDIRYFQKRAVVFVKEKIKQHDISRLYLFKKLLNRIEENNITTQSNFMIIYHGDFLNQEFIETEICVELNTLNQDIFGDNEQLLPFIRILPKGDYCCSIFQGTIQSSKQRYEEMQDFIKANSRKEKDFFVFYYLIAAAESKSPEKAVFEFQIPLKPDTRK